MEHGTHNVTAFVRYQTERATRNAAIAKHLRQSLRLHMLMMMLQREEQGYLKREVAETRKNLQWQFRQNLPGRAAGKNRARHPESDYPTI